MITDFLPILSPVERKHLWHVGYKKGLVKDPAPSEPPEVEELLPRLLSYDHETWVLAMASDASWIAYNIMEKMISKPIYMCARGETSAVLLDDHNRVIITPRGQYRGVPNPLSPIMPREHVRRHRKYTERIDNRVIDSITPNPKKPGSAAHAHYDQYQVGKTVTWHFLNTDITKADFRYDERRGFVSAVAPGGASSTKDTTNG